MLVQPAPVSLFLIVIEYAALPPFVVMVWDAGVIVTVGAPEVHAAAVVYVTVILILSMRASSVLEVDCDAYPIADSATPKLEELISATVQVWPQRSLDDPYDALWSDVGQLLPVLACSVPVTVPALIILTLLSRIDTEEELFLSRLSTVTVMPLMVAPVGIEKPNPVAVR